MVLRMANRTGTESSINHGQELHHFLQREWAAQGTTRGAWCRASGFADTTLVRWSQGTSEPDTRTLRQIADALGKSLIDIMLEAKYITPEEAKDLVFQRADPNLEEAIRLDPSLSDAHREAHRKLFQAFRAAEQGTAGLAEAIQADPKLSPEHREAHRKLFEAFEAVESGKATKVTVRGRRRAGSR